MISIFIVSFDLYEHVLATFEKRKINFPRLHSWSILCCHYEISNILQHHQTFLPIKPWNFYETVLKHMWAQGWQGKRKQLGSILLRYQPSITCNSKWNTSDCNSKAVLKSTFDFTEIVKEWKWKRGIVCHYVRFITQLSYEPHIPILKCFTVNSYKV